MSEKKHVKISKNKVDTLFYPCTVISGNEREAMDKANIHYKFLSIYEIALIGNKKLLGVER